MARTMNLHDGSGRFRQVQTGLVDAGGAFLLLLDDDETVRFRFSDQESCISGLLGEAAELNRKLDKMHDKLDKLAASRDNKAKDLERALLRVMELENEVTARDAQIADYKQRLYGKDD